MASSGTGTAWDETIPTDSGQVSDTGLEIREVKKAVRIRLEKEHLAFAAGSVGGEHKAGSARAYYQDSFPTSQPSGDPLGTDDGGRLGVRSDIGGLYYYNPDSGAWVEVQLQTSDGLKDGIITGAKFASGAMKTGLGYAVMQDWKASGTPGGNAGAGWQTRALNQIVTNTGGVITDITSTSFQLAPGSYRIRARAPGNQCDGHQIRVNNVTAGNTRVGYGTSEFSANAGSGVVTWSECVAETSISDSSYFAIEHHFQTAKNTNGCGAPAASGGSEIYTSVEIWRL